MNSLSKQELLTQFFETFLTPLGEHDCRCHFIDSDKCPILMWKQKDIYILKIGTQKFISHGRTDKKGELYWKFKGSESEPVPNNSKTEQNPPTQAQSTETKNSEPVSNPPIKETTQPLSKEVEKFNQRIAKTKEIQQSHEQSRNSDQ